ncbi:hypothetical protein [Mediterraneibacter gnavus]|uniref:hypothetical protein n=1 Tax=Mediterraneibacter gnavus TaxID=33038 RepID=UPI0004676381|nr:hypothetical protein [Mediterraneibacter gnavus]
MVLTEISRSQKLKTWNAKKSRSGLGQWGDRNLTNQYVHHNYLKSISFPKRTNVDKYKDVPNRYRPEMVVSIDGESYKGLL